MRRFTALIFLLATSLCGFAQQNQDDFKIPVLNGHRMLTLEESKAPFTNTNFGINLGFGSTADFSSLSFIIEDSVIASVDNQLSYLDLDIDYKHQIKDWIAMYFSFSFNMRLGEDVQTLVLSGFDRVVTSETGWIFKIRESRKDLLSGNIWIRNTQASYLDIPGFVRDMVAGKDYLTVSKDVPVFVSGFGLLYAHGFSKLIGLSVEGQLVYGETLVRGEEQFQYSIGGAIDFDLRHKIKAPISVAIGGKINTISDIFSRDSSLLSTFNAKISYVGSKDFNFGIEYYDGYTPVDNNNKRVRLTGAGFNVNLFF